MSVRPFCAGRIAGHLRWISALRFREEREIHRMSTSCRNVDVRPAPSHEMMALACQSHRPCSSAAGPTRARNSSPVSQRTSQSPTSASRPGSAMRAKYGPEAVSQGNFTLRFHPRVGVGLAYRNPTGAPPCWGHRRFGCHELQRWLPLCTSGICAADASSLAKMGRVSVRASGAVRTAWSPRPHRPNLVRTGTFRREDSLSPLVGELEFPVAQTRHASELQARGGRKWPALPPVPRFVRSDRSRFQGRRRYRRSGKTRQRRESARGTSLSSSICTSTIWRGR